ncbi:MAG: RHS repeat-associated core domain-containing protein [bacterium]
MVIDRIAYTPYGESTRRLRSDVDGNGVVDGGDYGDVIQPLIGTPITSPTYRVEADLDRNGAITLADYDICIADDGRKIVGGGGVGETDLFSPGVRNSVGYCGYIHNEDTGLYTVRFRTYSATLGRWLTRDPAGYVDGMHLYAYAESRPITMIDPMGLDACGIKQDMSLRNRGILPTGAARAPGYAQRQARLARLRQHGISTTGDYIFWYYNGDSQPIHVSPSLEKQFREHEQVKPVIDGIKTRAIQDAANSMPCNFVCKPGASWTVILPQVNARRTTVYPPPRIVQTARGPLLVWLPNDPTRATYSYGRGFIWADLSCRVTVKECGLSGGKCKPTKVEVRCNAFFRSDDKFEEPLELRREYGGDVGGDPYWFTTRWTESFEGKP